MAGAGLRDPTPDERASLQELVDETPLDPRHVKAWLDAHPDVKVDDVVDTRSGETLYISLLDSGIVRSDDPALAEVLRRKPDPTKTDRYGRTGLRLISRGHPMMVGSWDWRTKVSDAKAYLEAWKATQNFKDVANLRKTSKNALGSKGIPEDASDIVRSFLTGETGSEAIQESKVRVKAGLPGVKSGGRRRRTRRRRRSVARTRSVRRGGDGSPARTFRIPSSSSR